MIFSHMKMMLLTSLSLSLLHYESTSAAVPHSHGSTVSRSLSHTWAATVDMDNHNRMNQEDLDRSDILEARDNEDDEVEEEDPHPLRMQDWRLEASNLSTSATHRTCWPRLVHNSLPLFVEYGTELSTVQSNIYRNVSWYRGSQRTF